MVQTGLELVSLIGPSSLACIFVQLEVEQAGMVVGGMDWLTTLRDFVSTPDWRKATCFSLQRKRKDDRWPTTYHPARLLSLNIASKPGDFVKLTGRSFEFERLKHPNVPENDIQDNTCPGMSLWSFHGSDHQGTDSKRIVSDTYAEFFDHASTNLLWMGTSGDHHNEWTMISQKNPSVNFS